MASSVIDDPLLGLQESSKARKIRSNESGQPGPGYDLVEIKPLRTSP